MSDPQPLPDMDDEDEIVDMLNSMPPGKAAQAFIRLRQRVRKYRDVTEVEVAKLLAALPDLLDLNALQTGRLQVVTHECSALVRETIVEHDRHSPALHPLDRV